MKQYFSCECENGETIPEYQGREKTTWDERRKKTRHRGRNEVRVRARLSSGGLWTVRSDGQGKMEKKMKALQLCLLFCFDPRRTAREEAKIEGQEEGDCCSKTEKDLSRGYERCNGGERERDKRESMMMLYTVCTLF